MAKLARIATRQRADVCLRLKKRCQPSESVRRRNAQIAEESDTRIARLEDKMEILLSTMQSFIPQGALGNSVNVLQPLQPVHSLDGNSISSSTSYSNGTLVNTGTGLGISDGPPFATDSIAIASPNSYQSEERLEFFRSRMLPYFPFIDLTPDMTSTYLRQNRPFLFQAIHTVTIFSTQERLTQVEELKRVLFTSALLEVQSNIDLLLGLLTYLAWSTDAFLGRADLVSRLMMLAISLVYDLRLFKSSSPDVQAMMSITQGQAEETIQRPNDQMPDGFLERQRALLACFILSSNVSSHLGRQDAIRWTPQMEDALRVIALSKSCPADELFVFQVRLQLLKQRADYVRQQDGTDYARIGTAHAAASTPRFLYLKTLRNQLHELRSSFPPDLYHIDILNTHAQYVGLYINQLGYSISRDSLAVDQSGRIGDGGMLLEFQRLECLWQSVENIKSWLDEFYRIPCSKIVGQPFHFWSQMILTITLLKYLSTLKDPEWDCQAVRNTVDLTSTMDCMLQKLDLGSKEPELQCNDHLLKLLSKLLNKCRLWAEARLTMASQLQDMETRPCRSANSDTTSHNHHIPDLDQIIWMQSMDLGDDQWFEDVLGIPTTFY
ncbi:hypothetical protein N7471_006831 [Penicillium samsonianum]|uniref:uncharacterized protein n=1 Tax=Penicillium samsonianum TaxID=1882272 RepID=UPI002546885B|nr:uncharacterized protein N7471_006831 [Penicillium samsonianum]KAJ6140345.1 hypothetical protein N7471_006831 [Penicillium samsonianum]